MSDAIIALSACTGAYVCGGIPFGYIVVRLCKHRDIRQYGSGNIGATNVWRTFGPALGTAAFILDAAKGAIPTALARLIPGELPGFFPIVVGLCAIIGHTRSVFLKGSGGKGVATACGVITALSPLSLLTALSVWILFFLFSRYVSLASLAAAAVLPFCLLFFEHDIVLFCAGAVICILIFRRHRSNIKRLAAGTEHRFHFPWNR